MSKPSLNHEDAIQGALSEAVSAMSALNMKPEPIDGPAGEYLSDRDAWAAHSMEHIHVTVELLNRAWQEREALKWKIYRLETQLREARQNGHKK